MKWNVILSYHKKSVISVWIASAEINRINRWIDLRDVEGRVEKPKFNRLNVRRFFFMSSINVVVIDKYSDRKCCQLPESNAWEIEAVRRCKIKPHIKTRNELRKLFPFLLLRLLYWSWWSAQVIKIHRKCAVISRCTHLTLKNRIFTCCKRSNPFQLHS